MRVVFAPKATRGDVLATPFRRISDNFSRIERQCFPTEVLHSGRIKINIYLSGLFVVLSIVLMVK